MKPERKASPWLVMDRAGVGRDMDSLYRSEREEATRRPAMTLELGSAGRRGRGVGIDRQASDTSDNQRQR
jgi:hypothetical protein